MIYIYIYIYIYIPNANGLSTLPKELKVASRVMQNSSNELRPSVAGSVKKCEIKENMIHMR